MRIQAHFDFIVAGGPHVHHGSNNIPEQEGGSLYCKKKSRNPFNEQIEKKSAMVFL